MNLSEILKSNTINNYGQMEFSFNNLLKRIIKFKESGKNLEGKPYIVNKVPPNSKVLEFGPASGFMTKYLNEVLNCEVTIIEIDPVCAQSAGKFAKHTIIANIDDEKWYTEIQNEQFDIITFCDVLEHLKSPWKILALAKSILTENGSILCSVPNVAHHTIISGLLEDKFDYSKCGLLDITHLRFFTDNSLDEVHRYAGLSVLSTGHTYVTALTDNEDTPWQKIASNPVIAKFQKKLSFISQHAVLQYTYELKKHTWFTANNISSVKLISHKDELKEEDFLLISNEAIQKQIKELTLIIEKKNTSIDNLLSRYNFLKDVHRELIFMNKKCIFDNKKLKKKLKEKDNEIKLLHTNLHILSDYFDKEFNRKIIKIWNSSIKIIACFFIFKNKIKKFRSKYSIRKYKH